MARPSVVMGRVSFVVLLAVLWITFPVAVMAEIVSQPDCPVENVFYGPGNGEDIVVPDGYKVEVFARDLNFPTGIAFRGEKHNFQVFVLESGTGLPGRCNNSAAGGVFNPDNPFTPGLVIFDRQGHRVAGQIGKPSPVATAFSPMARRSVSPSRTDSTGAPSLRATRTRASAGHPVTATIPRGS